MKKTKSYKQIAFTVSLVTILINTVLSVFKLTAGIIGNSGAMLSDAVHSISDVLSTLIVMVGIKFASKESDKQHRYGHERIECAAAIILAVILFATGLGIGYSGILKITQSYETLEIPGLLPLIAAIVSIVVKEGMFWYTRHFAVKLNSGSLKADAWHHRSDALSSIGSFIGILGARLGFPVLDPIASIVICLMILKAAYDIFKDGIDKLVDKACDDKTIEKIVNIIMAQKGVIKIDDLKTRMFGSKIYIDVEIEADGNLTLFESHEIAENVHHSLEKELETVKHCMVHVNPAKNEDDKTQSENSAQITEKVITKEKSDNSIQKSEIDTKEEK